MQELFLFCFLLATKTILNNSLNKDDITITKKQKKNILIQKGQIHKNIFILNTLWLEKKN